MRDAPKLRCAKFMVGPEFAKNPIGFYMHERDNGVLVRWEDLRIEGDKVLGKPCINLSNTRGQQTIDEIGTGFLNAASFGQFVVDVSVWCVCVCLCLCYYLYYYCHYHT